MIEARWLFDAGRRIEVVIHPQSIVHSMVEFEDGSILAQLGATDMRIPISYALAFPQRITSGTLPVSFPELGSLTFREPDMDKFPLLKAAYQALEDGGASAPIILNAADEFDGTFWLTVIFDIPRIVPVSRYNPLAAVETRRNLGISRKVVSLVRGRWDA
jgi:1-deoxy-D-xylulose 5-phosphate reductoisomerase